ncbi:MAG: cysteine peptidase family C39 domain-containing protein [Isosphaeraceae bacterium]
MVFLPFVLSGYPSRADGLRGRDDEHRYDCGTLALHMLLAIEGIPTDIAALESRLPPPGPEGHSMAELRGAAGSIGLRLSGERLSLETPPLDRCALVLVQRGVHGHFVLVRPVGHSGKLVQVIDPATEPRVVEAADLVAAPGWTGMALLPYRPNRGTRAIWVLALSSALGAVIWAIASPSRGRRVVRRICRSVRANASVPPD